MRVPRHVLRMRIGSLALLPFVIAACLELRPSVAQALDPCDVKVPVVSKPELNLGLPIAGLSNPVYVTSGGDGSERLFIVEQPGTIRIYQEGVLLSQHFLDIRHRVSSGGERGLLSVAFHPDYERNGRFFVNYTRRPDGDTIIAEYRVSSDPNVADPNSERVILAIDQPFANHNGGLIKFGPDGMLYIGMGDGGSGGDPMGHGQNRATLLGDLLRIDVDGGSPYAIPDDNPFVGMAGVHEEIWAYGLRNPWRFSFDRCDGRLFLADVGQNRLEEVDLIEKGGNYGWNIMEGSQCFRPSVGCNSSGLKLPIAEYDHSQGCSITGGYVYRGTQFSALIGHYLFGDYCSGKIWSLFQDESGQWVMTELLNTDLSISSFGEDEVGELYVIDHGGIVYRIRGSGP